MKEGEELYRIEEDKNTGKFFALQKIKIFFGITRWKYIMNISGYETYENCLNDIKKHYNFYHKKYEPQEKIIHPITLKDLK